MRIANITLPEKHIVIALTYVHGIGKSTAKKILTSVGVLEETLTSKVTAEQEQEIRKITQDIIVEGDLRRKVSGNIKRLQDMGTYKGKRHAARLPVRGQRTKTNARTRKGRRVTMGSGKVKIQKK